MSPALQRRLLAWLAVVVGLAACAVTGAWLWLSRVTTAPAPGDFRLVAAGLGLLLLVMALRCAAVVRSR